MGSPPAGHGSAAFERPVFIVAAPRSGSTLLFETLALNDAFWTLGGEGHAHVEAIPALNPRSRGFESNRLVEHDATPTVCAQLRDNYRRSSVGLDSDTKRFLEKTPKNALRIRFLRKCFPDARFVFLYRRPESNISAMMEAWRSGRFVTYPDLPGWFGSPWSLVLIPGWRDLIGKSLAEIASRQWCTVNESVLEDLSRLPRHCWMSIRYEDVVAQPRESLSHVCAFCEVPVGEALDRALSRPLRPSRYTLTAPDPVKWRRIEAAMEPFLAAALATYAAIERAAATS